MLKNLRSSFAVRIVLIVFMCLLFSSAFTLSIAMLLVWIGVRIPTMNFIIYILLAFAVSCVAGTFIAVIISRKFSSSHNKFKRALKEVTNGNFNVMISETGMLYGELAQDFNSMVKELKSVQVLRTDFVSNFSHEFKTPIASINGFAELLTEENVTDEERKEYAQIIYKESSRLLNLSKNTLLLSRLDGKQIVSDKKVFSLDAMLERNLIIFEKQLTEKNINIVTSLEKINFYWDEDLLSQVFINLFSNAIKYGKTGGKIEVALKKDGEKVIVKVADDGIGMDAETARRMFERYFQGDASHRSEGSGLGLAIAEKIVFLCGGKISAESKNGEGTVFTVVLPMHKV